MSMAKFLACIVSICLTVTFLPHCDNVNSDGFHKIRSESTMRPHPFLFPTETLPPRVRYEKLFSYLPLLQESNPKRGRPPVSPNVVLKALIYKSLRRLATLCDIVFELQNNPSMCAAVGLSPLGHVPSVERFSTFLRDKPNPALQEIRRALLANLISQRVITGKSLTLDSCPIVVALKENNLKTGLRRNRFDKTRPPRGDKDARLGVLCHFPSAGGKEIQYFWGYRNHVISDAATELPLEEMTHPANVSDLTPAKTLLGWAHATFGQAVEAVAGDAQYDSEEILEFIVSQLKASPVIPHNPRNEQTIGHQIKGGKVYCAAELPMVHRGKMTVKSTGITYRQYGCPLHWRKKIAQQYLFCPAQHPKYVEQKGCNVLIRLTPTVRTQIHYDSRQFKDLYKQRPNIERIFSRLLAIAAQEPTVRGLNAIRNHMTIGHITVLLVALVAHSEGHADKLRYVRSFVPNFLTKR